VIITVTDAIESPFLICVIVSSTGFETKITPVYIQPGCDLMLFSVTAYQDIGQTIVIDISKGRGGAVYSFKTAKEVILHLKVASATIPIDVKRFGARTFISGKACHRQ
jgi:hypothetical protein